MSWALWRLHRNQAIFAAAALAAIAVFLLISGIHLANVYHQALATCGAAHICAKLPDIVFQGDGWLWVLASATIAIPALFGMFWGVPLVAKEVEDGTHKLAWAQSVPRQRWLAANLAWALLAAAGYGAGIAALLTWWLGPENALQLNRFEPGHFDIQGIVPIGYSVFAVSLGIAAGAWFRRVMPALATTLGGYAAVRAGVEVFLRPHYLTAVSDLFPLTSNGPPGAAWVYSYGIALHGHLRGGLGPGRPELSIPTSATQVCAAKPSGLPLTCLDQHGWRLFSIYQPASRFWAFQGIETGIFVVLAALLVTFACWRVLTADA